MVLLASALAVYAGAALLAIVLPRPALSAVYPLCLIAALAACAADIGALAGNDVFKGALPLGLPTVGLRFRLDSLSAFFGLIVNLGIAASSLYGAGIGRAELSKRIEPFYPAFCAAMNLVLLADDAFGFLFFWELMSLSSWALVVSTAARPPMSISSWRPWAQWRCSLLLAGWRGRPAAMVSIPSASTRSRRWCRVWYWPPPCSAPDRRRASCRFTPGCRSPIPPRQATCPRS